MARGMPRRVDRAARLARAGAQVEPLVPTRFRPREFRSGDPRGESLLFQSVSEVVVGSSAMQRLRAPRGRLDASPAASAGSATERSLLDGQPVGPVLCAAVLVC